MKKNFWKLFSFWKKEEEKKEEKAEEKEVDYFAKYEGLEGDNNPRLVSICAEYMASLCKVPVYDCSDMNPLLKKLPDLKLDENYVLDNYNPHPRFRGSIGQNLDLYVRPKSVEKPRDIDFGMSWYEAELKMRYTNEPKMLKAKLEELHSQMKPLPKHEDPFKHITLPFTEEAVWQAYLLRQARHRIGMYWHGLYEKRVFINGVEDIDGLAPEFSISEERLERFKVEAKAHWSETMRPMVILDGNKAYISHYWFSLWGGLSQVKCLVSYDPCSHTVTGFRIKVMPPVVPYAGGPFF